MQLRAKTIPVMCPHTHIAQKRALGMEDMEEGDEDPRQGGKIN